MMSPASSSAGRRPGRWETGVARLQPRHSLPKFDAPALARSVLGTVGDALLTIPPRLDCGGFARDPRRARAGLRHRRPHLPPAARPADGSPSAAAVPQGLPLGHRHLGLPGRGGGARGRPRSLDLGHVRADAGTDPRRLHRRRQRRPLSPLQGRRGADEGIGRQDLPLLDRLAAPAFPTEGARSTTRAWRSTTGWSTSCCAPASSPSPPSITGTCRRRCRTRAAGRRATRRWLRRLCRPRGAQARRSGRPHLHAQRDADLRRAWPSERRLRAGPACSRHAELNQVRHHAVLAHGLAVQAIRANARRGTKVGPAENITTALPAIETPEHIRAAELATREVNAPYLTVMLEGRYTDAYLADAGADAPKFTPQDLEIIASPVDFVGLNVYSPGPLRDWRARPRRATRRSDSVLVSAHGVGVADRRPRDALLGAAPCREAVEREGHLHHRERRVGSRPA